MDVRCDKYIIFFSNSEAMFEDAKSPCGHCHGTSVTHLFSLKKSRFLHDSPSLPKGTSNQFANV